MIVARTPCIFEEEEKPTWKELERMFEEMVPGEKLFVTDDLNRWVGDRGE